MPILHRLARVRNAADRQTETERSEWATYALGSAAWTLNFAVLWRTVCLTFMINFALVALYLAKLYQGILGVRFFRRSLLQLKISLLICYSVRSLGRFIRLTSGLQILGHSFRRPHRPTHIELSLCATLHYSDLCNCAIISARIFCLNNRSITSSFEERFFAFHWWHIQATGVTELSWVAARRIVSRVGQQSHNWCGVCRKKHEDQRLSHAINPAVH